MAVIHFPTVETVQRPDSAALRRGNASQGEMPRCRNAAAHWQGAKRASIVQMLNSCAVARGPAYHSAVI